MPKFQPGQSGNPTGRPKSALGIRAEIERRWGANGAKLVGELSDLAKDANSRVRLQAVELLLAYAAGKPTQSSTINLHGSELIIRHELGIPEPLAPAPTCSGLIPDVRVPLLPGRGNHESGD